MAVDLGAARPRCWSELGRTTREIPTGGWRTSRPEYVEATAPCRGACPAGEPIAMWIERARRGDFVAAWSLLREENPFPAIVGRVCAHPCESACNRAGHDGAVGINALEQFVGDWGLARGAVAAPTARRAEKVAVVGGGPAGLAGAYHLARLGYGVTLFEAEPKLGGLLRHGIPAYRLPRTVLDREIELVLALGIEVVTGHRLRFDPDRAALDGYAAVLLATGAGTAQRLGVAGETASGIDDGLAFLRRISAGEAPPPVERLMVVGGGSTAMDVARSARRLGNRLVTIVALESRETMPAAHEEIAQALAEGIDIRNGFGVTSFAERDGRLCAVRLAPAHLGRGADGRIVPVFEDGEGQEIETDRAVLAIGQRPDLDDIPAGARGRNLLSAGPDGVTPVDRLFAAGDAASLSRTVSHAIGGATRAARAIHARLSGQSLRPFSPAMPHAVARPDHGVAFSEINVHRFPRLPQNVRREAAPVTRVRSFAEVVDGLAEPEARAEAQRCFTCGRCTVCDTCLMVCPDMAIARANGGYRLAAEHCKGCGLCVRECPRGALAMVDER